MDGCSTNVTRYQRGFRKQGRLISRSSRIMGQGIYGFRGGAILVPLGLEVDLIGGHHQQVVGT